MLARRNRLTSSAEFSAAVRHGRRAGSATVVVHLHVAGQQRDQCEHPVSPDQTVPARVGLVVSKAVGNSVARTEVKRRLRHLARARLALLPPAAVLVVRALPAAAGASSAALGADLDTALARVTRAERRRRPERSRELATAAAVGEDS